MIGQILLTVLWFMWSWCFVVAFVRDLKAPRDTIAALLSAVAAHCAAANPAQPLGFLSSGNIQKVNT